MKTKEEKSAGEEKIGSLVRASVQLNGNWEKLSKRCKMLEALKGPQPTLGSM